MFESESREFHDDEDFSIFYSIVLPAIFLAGIVMIPLFIPLLLGY